MPRGSQTQGLAPLGVRHQDRIDATVDKGKGVLVPIARTAEAAIIRCRRQARRQWTIFTAATRPRGDTHARHIARHKNTAARTADDMAIRKQGVIGQTDRIARHTHAISQAARRWQPTAGAQHAAMDRIDQLLSKLVLQTQATGRVEDDVQIIHAAWIAPARGVHRNDRSIAVCSTQIDRNHTQPEANACSSKAMPSANTASSMVNGNRRRIASP